MPSLRLPPPLQAGDHVAIVAPARRLERSAIADAENSLRSWNLQVLIGQTIGAACYQFAGSDDWRRQDVQRFLDDPTVRAIWFARGGYGSVRIIDDLEWDGFLQSPKWLCGYSDITVFHCHLQRFGVATLHAPLCLDWSTASQRSRLLFRQVLFGAPLQYRLPAHELNRKGKATGTLIGGNLSVLYSLLGSVSFPQLQGALLFLEDVDEHLYHIDRMMTALRRAGALRDLAGLVVGHFLDMHNKDPDNPFGKQAYEIIAEHIAAYRYPVCFGFFAGHDPQNYALVMGAQWQLEVKDGGVSLAGTWFSS